MMIFMKMRSMLLKQTNKLTLLPTVTCHNSQCSTHKVKVKLQVAGNLDNQHRCYTCVSAAQMTKYQQQTHNGCNVIQCLGRVIRTHCQASVLVKKLTSISAFSTDSTLYMSDGKGSWDQPTGFDTGIVVWHPFIKKKVPLILTENKVARWYMCGPTVYDSAHIGHASSYVRFDIIRRVMANVFGIDSMVVLGITDVDDKIIKRIRETGTTITQLTRAYEMEFFQDMRALNVSMPTTLTRVTDHIQHIIYFIQGIIDKGLAYVTEDGSVYFDVQKYGRYGQMRQGLPDSDQTSDQHKRNTADFALWKGSKEGEIFWASPWGNGRPGWHIECSAMASSIFGANFDIHSGGVDLMFPHHENEIAQSQGHFGCWQWANYWMHTGHLHLKKDAEKMSKSLKNTISISQLLEDYTADQFRLLCLMTHYRTSIEFSKESMGKAVVMMNQLNSLLTQCDAYMQGHFDCPDISQSELYQRIHTTREAVEEAFGDDFDTSGALDAIFGLMKYINQVMQCRAESVGFHGFGPRNSAAVGSASVYIRRVLKQLGLDMGHKKTLEDGKMLQDFQFAMDSLTEFRAHVRNLALDSKHIMEALEKHGLQPKDNAKSIQKELFSPILTACDNVREKLASANIQIKDLKKSSTWNVQNCRPNSNFTARTSSG